MGFIDTLVRLLRLFYRCRAGLFAALLVIVPQANAVEINVVGLFSGKALVEIDGAKPRVISVGETTAEGAKLISVDSGAAVFEIGGKRERVPLGNSAASTGSSGSKPTVTLIADSQGHFLSPGSINGAPTRFLVDTGATAVSMSAAEARRLGINYLAGQAGSTSTANGVVRAYKVTLNAVRIGDITLNQVDGVIVDGAGLQVTLLGMSFLSRVEMRREGSALTLIKQY